MVKISQIRYLIEIARAGSVSAAARNLFMTQPSLSQQILNLEAELGVPLLVRHPKSVTLTDAGEQFVRQGSRILGEIDQLTELMRKNSLLQAGTLRLGLLWIAGYIGLFDILARFRTKYPGLEYELRIDGSSALLKLLLDRKLHAAFMTGEAETFSAQPDLIAHKIQDDKYVAVVARGDPLAASEKISLEQLAGRKVVMPAPASAFRRRVENIFAEAHMVPDVLCETSQSDLVIQLAAQGLGIGFSSRSIAERMNDGSYVLVPLDRHLSRQIWYVTLKELREYPSVAALTEFVEVDRS